MNCIDHGRHGGAKGYTYAKWDGQTVRLHRKVYCQSNGLSHDDIAGMVVRHTCDNTRCINPAHLLIGSQADNIQDKVERERCAKGAGHGRVRLTQELVDSIRSLYVKGSKSCGTSGLAERFDLSQRTIWKVIHNRDWITNES